MNTKRYIHLTKLIGSAAVGIAVFAGAAVCLAFGANLLGTTADQMWEDAVGLMLMMLGLVVMAAYCTVVIVLIVENWFYAHKVVS